MGLGVRQRGAGTSGGRRWTSDVQVLAGLGGLLALLAGAVAAAVILILALENDTETFSERHVQYATAIHDAALTAKTMANQERGFLISGDRTFIEDLDELTSEARAAFVSAERYAVSGAQRQAANEASVGFERWIRALESDIATYDSGFRRRAVETSLGPTRQLRKTYERSLERAHLLGLSSIESATESVSASASRSVTILLVYLVLALVLGVVVVFWIAHSVLRPAYDLTRNALNVVNRARIIVEEDGVGSHHAIAVEVPIEVVNDLAESALETRGVLRHGNKPAET